MTILLERGANVNASGPLGTPLEVAWIQWEYWRRPKIVEMLIEHGGVNNRPDPDGKVASKEQMLEAARRQKYRKFGHSQPYKLNKIDAARSLNTTPTYN